MLCFFLIIFRFCFVQSVCPAIQLSNVGSWFKLDTPAVKAYECNEISGAITQSVLALKLFN